MLVQVANMRHLLSPVDVQLGHCLFNGMLLQCEYIDGEGVKATGWICNECMRALERDTLPKHALGNNLWVGRVPHELSMLTLPEQMLVAQHIPRCYVVKLYPCNRQTGDPNLLQRGLVSNVSLYNMNTDAVAQMVEGQLLPQPCIQLASVLAVMFIGGKTLPKTWLKTTFWVQW